MFQQYEHHGTLVWVDSELKGKHRSHCLCFQCDKFKPGTPTNCPIAQATYENCVKFNTTTPVYECPEFKAITMTGDNMEIVHPKDGQKRLVVDSNNQVTVEHDCTYAGDHSDGLNVDDKCVICGKTLGDLIAEGFDPTRVRIPIIITPEEEK